MPNRASAAASAVEENLEHEAKFAVPATFVIPLKLTERATTQYVGRRVLRATYYDTADVRLARNGITLRHRTGEGEPTWTLKVPAAADLPEQRIERSVPGPAEPIPAVLADLVLAHLRSAPLVEVARLTTRRDSWALLDPAGDSAAELVDDVVSVIKAGKLSTRFREIEVEQKGRGTGPFDKAVRQLTDGGAIRGAFTSKLVHSLGAIADAPADVPPPTSVKRSDPAGALVAFLLRKNVRRLISLDIGVRLGDDDALHQMRVACRRLRSDLRTFSPLFEQGETQTLRTELAWLADSLGAARDVEVLRARLVKTAEADRLNPVSPAVFARLDAALAQSESDALDRVAQALGTDRYLRLLDLAVAVARAPRMTSLANEPIRDVFPPLVSRAVADLDRKVRKLTHKAPDATWHTARIRAKRARYAAEATIDVFGKKAKKTASAVAGVQTILGDHQDAAVAADALVTIARDHSDDLDLVLLCGSLAERERASIHVTRRRFRRAWKTAMSSSVRAWLPKPEPREG